MGGLALGGSSKPRGDIGVVTARRDPAGFYGVGPPVNDLLPEQVLRALRHMDAAPVTVGQL